MYNHFIFLFISSRILSDRITLTSARSFFSMFYLFLYFISSFLYDIIYFRLLLMHQWTFFFLTAAIVNQPTPELEHRYSFERLIIFTEGSIFFLFLQYQQSAHRHTHSARSYLTLFTWKFNLFDAYFHFSGDRNAIIGENFWIFSVSLVDSTTVIIFKHGKTPNTNITNKLSLAH